MAGKTPAKAVKAFVEPIQNALGLWASGKVTADSYTPADEGLLVFNGGEQVKLRGDGKISLSVSMRYEIVETRDPEKGPWKVKTTGYMYDLQVDDVSAFEYHWHPISKSHEAGPHLHCSAALDKGHIPTGRIMIEDVLSLAGQLGAEPNDGDRWRDLYALNREKFARGATWGVGPG